MKGYVAVIGVCSFMAGVSYILALVGPWWSNTKDFWTVETTLWNVHLNGKVNAASVSINEDVSWEDLCDQSKVYSLQDKEWCDESRVKIKAARGTTIVATVFAWTTFGFLVIGLKADNPQILSCGGGISGVLSLALAVSAIAIGAWFPEESALDTAGWGFVFLCVGAFFSLTSMLTAVGGCVCSQLSTGFQTFDQGSKWGGWKPKRKEMPPPALPPPLMPLPMVIPRPVVAMPPIPPPAPIGQKGDFGIAPVGSAAVPNPMSPSRPQPSGGDFGVDAVGAPSRPQPLGGDFGVDAVGVDGPGGDFGISGSIPQPWAMENKAIASGQGRSSAYGKDFGLDRE
jgi:hypothetical protein